MGGGAGCLFEAGRLLHVPFSAFRIGAQVGPNLFEVGLFK